MAWRKPTNLRGWLNLLARHKKKFFFPALFVMILVMIGSLWVPREYRSEAKFQRKNDVAMTELGQTMTDRQLEPIRRSLHHDMLGRHNMKRLVDDLTASDPYVAKLWQFPRTPDGSLTSEGKFKLEDLISELKGQIGVRYTIRARELDMISVSFTNGDRQLAPKVVNRLVENYIKTTRDQLNAMLLAAKKFFKGEVDRYGALVQELESKKLRFELDNPGLTPDDPASVQAKLVQLRAKRDNIVSTLEVSKQRRVALAEFIKKQPEVLVTERELVNPAMAEVLARRERVVAALDESLTTFRRTEFHPEVKKLRRLLAELDREVEANEGKGEVKELAEPNVQRISAEQDLEELSGEILALERQRDELNANVEQYELRNRNFFPIRNEYLKMEKDLAAARNQLKFWDEKLRDTNISLTAEIGQKGVRLSFLQHAPDLARPSKPTLFIIGAASLALGLATGAGMVLLAELLDHSFHSAEQAVDDLKLPVLGAVNEIVTPSKAFRRKLMGWGVFPALSALMIVILSVAFGVAYLSLQYPHRWDQFKSDPVSFVRYTVLQGR